jgi:hypothetical protein
VTGQSSGGAKLDSGGQEVATDTVLGNLVSTRELAQGCPGDVELACFGDLLVIHGPLGSEWHAGPADVGFDGLLVNVELTTEPGQGGAGLVGGDKLGRCRRAEDGV